MGGIKLGFSSLHASVLSTTLRTHHHDIIIMAPLTEDDRTLIRILRIEKHLNAHQMANEFPARNWSKNNLNRLIRQIDANASSKRKRCYWPSSFGPYR